MKLGQLNDQDQHPGRFFQEITPPARPSRHAVPRTVAEGERALYHAL